MALAKSQKSLKSWTKQKWRTKSGKPSAKTGERYLPTAAIKSLSDSEYAEKALRQVSSMWLNLRRSQPKPKPTGR